MRPVSASSHSRVTLLAAAVGVPKVFPAASPRRVIRVGFGLLLLGIVVLLAALDAGAGPEVVTWPLLLMGLGIGSLASQLGAVTVSSVPDSQSGEVGGIQNTVTNLGASIGTALTGAVLIGVLTTTFLGSVAANPAVPQELAAQAQVELSSGVPFVSDADLNAALDKAGVPPATAQAIVDENASSRINGLRAALAVLAFLALAALLCTRRLPTTQPGAPDARTTKFEGRSAHPRLRVTLHHARLRHDGQVMRWSKRRRGSQTPMGNWKITMSRTPTCEVCLQRWHSTLKTPRSASGFSEVAARLSDCAGALEKRARLPKGSATVAPAPPDPTLPDSAGEAQKSARLPSGSGSLSPRDSATSGAQHGVVDARGERAVGHGARRRRCVLEHRTAEARGLGETHRLRDGRLEDLKAVALPHLAPAPGARASCGCRTWWR